MKDSQLLRYSRRRMLLEHAPHPASLVRWLLRTHGYLEAPAFDDRNARPRLGIGRAP